MRCAVFGATGYIGSRLVPDLVRAGHTVRAVARNPGTLATVPWRGQVEILAGDVTDAASVAAAVAGQDVVYYLVHSLLRRDFVERDRAAAHTVAGQARTAGVGRIVYLGGIIPDGPEGRDGRELSPHLASRAEVGQILLASGVPTAVLGAAIIIGSGSASFEMLRYLTERLPAMVTPRWVHNRVQPIAVGDVLHYLTHAATLPSEVNRGFDIGGPDVLTYLDLTRRYAAAASLPRRVVAPVPVLTPWLSAQWVGLVTPVPGSIAVPLVESLVHEVVCREHDIAAHIPDPEDGPTPCDRAIEMALAHVRRAGTHATWPQPTTWPESATWPRAAAPQPPADPLPTDPAWSGGIAYEDVRERRIRADAQTLWDAVESVGGGHGWYSFPPVWSVRGWAGRLADGVGILRRGRRSRRDPRRLKPGEAVDWWRVEHVERPRLLRLRAEMRLPGRAWLEMSAAPDPAAPDPAAPDRGGSVYRQRAVFWPRGLAGELYWQSTAPFRDLVFGGMARAVVTAAEHRRTPTTTPG
jgi:uncharacterized protein YbjT (DUF2867 family)